MSVPTYVGNYDCDCYLLSLLKSAADYRSGMNRPRTFLACILHDIKYVLIKRQVMLNVVFFTEIAE